MHFVFIIIRSLSRFCASSLKSSRHFFFGLSISITVRSLNVCLKTGDGPGNCYRPLIIIITSELIFQMNTPAHIEKKSSKRGQKQQQNDQNEKNRNIKWTNEEQRKREEKWTFFWNDNYI